MWDHVMAGSTTRSAIMLLIIGNAMAIVSDVLVKMMGAEAPIFQFIFLRTALTVLLLLPFYRQFTHIRPFAGLTIHLIRAVMHLVGMFCMVTALTHLPLATANAIFYLAPLLVMLLAVVMFKEKLTRL